MQKAKMGIAFSFSIILLLSCAPSVDLSQVDMDGPPTVIYQVAEEYVNLVPVVLNDEKTKVMAYPAPKDMYHPNGELRFPTPLGKGVYLDQIGVGLNTAYISLTIEEYAVMETPPTLDQIYQLIVSKDPFKRMYNLGNRKQYIEVEMVKEIVSSRKYKSYERLK